MKAFLLRRYGGPDAVELADVPDPGAAGPGEIVVDVRAASVNPVDFKIREGALKPLLKLKLPIVLGNDLAGVVREVGPDVRRFQAGDEIYARVEKDRLGAFAERAVVREEHAGRKPARLSFEEAAAVPLAGLTAWQALVDHGGTGAGHKVLIHAGAGGVGTLAIQVAKHLGAFVATTASARGADLVRSLGADLVVDYKTERFEDRVRDYDLVFDTLGGETQRRSLGVLKPGGILVDIVGPPDAAFAREAGANLVIRVALGLMGWKRARLARRLGVRYRFLFMRPSGEQLERLGALIDAGELRPIIDEVYPFARALDAIAHSESGRAKGKVVIKIA